MQPQADVTRTEEAVAHAYGGDVGKLIALVQRLSFARSMEEVTGSVTAAVRELTGADGASFVLRDGDCCFHVDEQAIGPLWKGCRFPLSACIAGWVMLNRQAAVIKDIYQDPRIPHDAYRPTFVKSLMMVPVRIEEPVAAIGAYWARCHQPSPDQLELLQGIAHSASLALVNLDLLDTLKAAAAAKSRLVASVSHDLRQPLQSLALFASVIEQDNLSDRSRQALDRLRQSIEQMGHHLAAITALAMVDVRVVAGQRRPVLLDPLLSALIEEMRPQADAKGVQLRSVKTTAVVESDPKLLLMILRNLIANAIRYTPSGKVLVGCRRRGKETAVEVYDTGIGIDDKHLKLIFEEFYQVGNESRDSRLGLGLGLSMVERLTHLLDHRVLVRSKPGSGSTFSVLVRSAE